jgi:hypothetical protein
MRIHGLGQLGIAGALDTIAQTIQSVEGYYPNTLAYRNNNPGNLVYTSYYAQNYGAVPGDGGFAKFPDYDTGYAALQHQIQVDAGRGDSFYDLTYSWLGSGQGGDWRSYAETLAGSLGVDPNSLVSAALSGSTDPGSFPVQVPDQPMNVFPETGPVSTSTVVILGLAALVGVLVLSR